jgi:TM2 domain-containing membrane protein YozV
MKIDVFCSKCGSEAEDNVKFCPKCGSSVSNSGESKPETKDNNSEFKRRPEWKSEGTTLVLTIVLGLFGFGGVGHLYLGQLGKGIGILIVGIILLVIAIFSYGIGLIILIPFAIWVIFDARKQCKYYNDYLEQNHKAPW